MATSSIVPKRGGNHVLFGVYQGGSALTNEYKLTKQNSYRSTTQLRNSKVLAQCETALHKARGDTSVLKFDGKLEVNSGKTIPTELDQEQLMIAVKETVQRYGLHSFFYMLGTDNNMKNIVKEPHSFTIEEVITEYEVRNADEPAAINDTNGVELPSSILSRFKCYDEYEKCDLALSRLAIEALISPTLRDKVQVRFGHLPEFEDFPGQIYFKMVLEVSNASVAQDIDKAVQDFKDIDLANYPGQNISDFATDALRHIKVMQGGYALPYQTGSNLIRKVCSTESAYFNRTMYNHLDKVRKMEDEHGPLKDPKLLEGHADYSSYGPVHICAILHKEYSALKKIKDWPALEERIPSSNLTPVSEEVNSGGRLCFKCNSKTHLANSPKCPHYNRGGRTQGGRGPGGRGGRGGRNSNNSNIEVDHSSDTNNTNDDDPNSDTSTSTNVAPASVWKYIHPSDKDQTIEVNGITFKFCAKCTCRKTGRVGFYNRTHTTSQHRGGGSNTTATGTEGAEGVVPVSASGNSPSSNHSPTSDVTAQADNLTSSLVDDPDELIFEGAFLSPAVDDGAWMASLGKETDESSAGVMSIHATDIMDTLISSDSSVPEYDDNVYDEYKLPSMNFAGVLMGPTVTFDEMSNPNDSDKISDSRCAYYDCSDAEPSSFDTEQYVDYADNFSHISPDFNCEGEIWFPTSMKSIESKDDIKSPIKNVRIACNNDSQIYFLAATSIESFSDPFEQPYYFSAVSSITSLDPCLESFHECMKFTPKSSTLELETTELTPFKVYMWTQFTVFLMVCSALFWDTVISFYSAFDGQVKRESQRTLRRRLLHKGHIPWSVYPKRWLILSCFMSFGNVSMIHPSYIIVNSIRETVSRIQRVHDLVDVTLPVINQYQGIRYTEWKSQSMIEPKYADQESFYDTQEFITNNIPNEEFHETSYELPVPPEYFFTCHSSQSEMERECITLDTSTTSIKGFDWLNLESICSSIHHVHCSSISSDYIPSVNNSPSPKAYNASLMGTVDLQTNTSPHSFPVIFDSGATLAISPSKEDFAGPIVPFKTKRTLGGTAGGIDIAGIGPIKWSFRAGDKYLVVHSMCYHVPDCKARLISPQRLFNKSKGAEGSFICLEEHAILSYPGICDLTIDYDSRTHLPTAVAKNLSAEGAQANVCVLNEENQNLSPSKRLLLIWHARFGHKGFGAIQRIFRSLPFQSERFKGASRLIAEDIPRCEVCEFAKAHRRPTKGNKTRTNIDTDGSLKVNDLRAGSSVSVDHFESRLKGRTYTSFGKTTSDQYVGGCTFVDHMSGYVHVEHQLGFSGSETIRAKQNYEKLALDHGVIIENYLADNGIFKAKAFVGHLREHNQKIQYCGVNAHHKNAVAERSIRTVSECARALLLHASLRWKSGIDSSLWPMAVDYATYIHNHLPNDHGIAPADLFTGTQIPRHKLKDIHVWGCPVYVLDPTLQQGKKLPRWEPRARQGIFLGFSAHHSSDVPLVLNISTGHISPQYHVVFDDSFSTVNSHAKEEDPPSFWNEISLDSHLYDSYVHRIPLDSDSSIQLHDEWLTPPELEERRRSVERQAKIRGTFNMTSLPSSKKSVITQMSQDCSMPIDNVSDPSPKFVDAVEYPSQLPDSKESSQSSNEEPRRSSRVNKGVFNSERFIDQVFLSSLQDSSQSYTESQLAYQADILTDLKTGEINCTDPRAYAAKSRLHDPDTPTYHEALTGVHAHKYEEAMKIEIRQLIKQSAWRPILRSKVPTTSDGKRRSILRGTWAFKLKRLPDGSPSKFKARYCVRGDLQREGIDYFETYAPVVQWSTVRLLLTMILTNRWTTKQVDYTNAFAQADLKEEVYIEQPKGFARKDKLDMVLKLIKSLYGLKQAPKTFFEKLKAGLLERGFIQSEMDKCLFMKRDMICVVYVDDTIFAGPDSNAIEEVITGLGVQNEEQRHTFELRDEGEVGDFLGIRIEKSNHNSFTLSQTGLIDKVLKTSKMEDANTAKTPAATTPLCADKEGELFSEEWDYATIVGMLMFLSTNSRPDIAYAVNQCARFTHCPRNIHATAIKRILRYLKGTRTKGMTISPLNEFRVDCYVDADFAGLWNVEDEQDPVSVKSRSGHLITFMGCPLQWSSKLQTQIALSTMESEYIALSQAMRELIGLREILKEIYTHVLNDTAGIKDISYHTISKTFGKIPQSIVHEDNEACLKFATMPKMSLRTKHIAIPYHFFRTKVELLEIKIVAINTENQLADQFTKGLPQDKFVNDRKSLMGW